MIEHNETLAEIVAQIRAAAYIQNADTPQGVLRLADRIEAAAKRPMPRRFSVWMAWPRSAAVSSRST